MIPPFIEICGRRNGKQIERDIIDALLYSACAMREIEERNMSDKDLYVKAKNRHSFIKSYMSDAEIIIEQEKEIERYREKIRNLENDNRSLRDEIDARTNYAEFEMPFIMYKGKKYRATTFCIHEDEVGQYIELKGIKLAE